MRRIIVANRPKQQVLMTPMIDVIFLLIIFFLCVNQYQKAESSEAVALPVASRETTLPPDETARRVIINVTADGTAYLGGKILPTGQIADVLTAERAVAGTKPVEVWIRADRQVPYRAIEPILAACSQAGVWKVAFKVVHPTTGPAQP